VSDADTPLADHHSAQPQPIQKKENNTGVPENLKNGVEHLSGYSMDDVKVHYNSDKPAHVQASSYAQGTAIYLGPGQEKHLPHEIWHVVQQKQGRVKPTIQMKRNVNINDEIALEKEADSMGRMSLHNPVSIVQRPNLLQQASMDTSLPVLQAYDFGAVSVGTTRSQTVNVGEREITGAAAQTVILAFFRASKAAQEGTSTFRAGSYQFTPEGLTRKTVDPAPEAHGMEVDYTKEPLER
jgi:hypothetical protein